jgi:hypothetical protein
LSFSAMAVNCSRAAWRSSAKSWASRSVTLFPGWKRPRRKGQGDFRRAQGPGDCPG